MILNHVARSLSRLDVIADPKHFRGHFFKNDVCAQNLVERFNVELQNEQKQEREQ